MIRRFVLPVTLVLALAFVAACEHDACSPGGLCFEAEAEFTAEIPATGKASFYLRGSSGDIALTAKPGSDRITIRATKRARADSPEAAEAMVESTQVRTSIFDESIVVLVRHPEESCAGDWSVDFEIAHPPECRYRVEISNGSLRAAGGRAGAILSTVNGDIEVRDGEGLTVPDTTSARMYLGTTNGTVSIRDLSLDGASVMPRSATGCLGACEADLRMRTVNGDVLLRGR